MDDILDIIDDQAEIVERNELFAGRADIAPPVDLLEELNDMEVFAGFAEEGRDDLLDELDEMEAE